MPKEIMERHASDNRYLHKDFHNSMNLGLHHLYETFGAQAVETFCQRLADGFYAPLIESVRKGGLSAVRAEFVRCYEAEDASHVLSFKERPGELLVTISECPAVSHMQKSGETPCEVYALTTSEVWRTVCERAGIGYFMLYYAPDTGAAAHLFFERREVK